MLKELLEKQKNTEIFDLTALSEVSDIAFMLKSRDEDKEHFEKMVETMLLDSIHFEAIQKTRIEHAKKATDQLEKEIQEKLLQLRMKKRDLLVAEMQSQFASARLENEKRFLSDLGKCFFSLRKKKK